MNLGWFNLLHLIPVFTIGIICSYTDFKYKKIFNKVLVFGFLYGIILYGGIILTSLIDKGSFDTAYFLEVLTNTVIAFLVSYGLWYLKLWTAGDAKLFTFFAFMVPLSFYSNSYLPFFPSFSILVNLFFPLLIGLAIISLISKVKNLKRGKLEFSLKFFEQLIFRFAYYVFIISFMSIVFQLLSKNFNFEAGLISRLVLIVSIIFLIKQFNKFAKDKKWHKPLFYSFAVIPIAYFLFTGEIEMIYFIVKIALVLTLFMVGLRSFINSYIEERDVVQKKIKNLERGDSLTKKSFKKLKERGEDRTKKIQKSIKNISYSLTKEELKFIKGLFKGDLDQEITTYKTFPFAPFLFLAVIVTLIWKSSFAVLIKEVFSML